MMDLIIIIIIILNQDLFGDSQESDGTNERPKFNASSPLEEVMAPSVLAMNLKFDSVPPDEW